MIEIARAAVDEVHAALGPADLHASLDTALQLEHATIPLYLTAYFSITSGTNTDTSDLIRSVVVEEMLHFAIVANLINALGGRPKINDPDLVPTYPDALPLGGPGGISATLGPISTTQAGVFAQIEQPEDPVGQRPGPDVATIGEFYQAIIAKVTELGDDAFGHDSPPQVTSRFYPTDRLFPIIGTAEAVAALNLIVTQGEGTMSKPKLDDGQFAHYYRFRQIELGRRFVEDPAAEEGFSYTGPEITINPAGVYRMLVDPKPSHYAGSPRAQRLLAQFDECYGRLLVALHTTFTGTPSALDRAVGVMYELRLLAIGMAETPIEENRPVGPDAPDLPRVTPLWRYPA